jgi:phosphonate transport system substrate-binding protein
MGKRTGWRVAVMAVALATAGTSAACGGEQTAAGESKTPVRFAVTDLQGLEELQREFGKFVEVLEQRSGLDVEFFAVNDRVAAAAALQADRVDVVFTGPAEYIVIRERTGATPLVAIRRPDYHSCIYTSVSSGVSSLSDLKGQKIAMSDVGSTSGHLGPSQLLVDAGLKPGEDVEVLTVGDAAHQALKRGDVEAVGVGCHDHEEYMADDDPTAYTMLKEGPPLPPDLLMARDDFDPATAGKVRDTFKQHFPELLTAMLDGKDNAKYENATLVEVSDGDYDVVRSMYRAIGVNDFSEFVGD